ncbi:hypothetical protein ATZ36_11815 [Candidatus Endomicrobiellum trichonymphae]|nr:hypothetical protein ATZ36_11815 [Candidatus Endomicrobium trichonymphae]
MKKAVIRESFVILLFLICFVLISICSNFIYYIFDMSYSFNKFVNSFIIVGGFIFYSLQYSIRLLFVFYNYLTDTQLKPINKPLIIINILIVITVITVLLSFCFYTRGKLRKAIEDQMRSVEIHTFVDYNGKEYFIRGRDRKEAGENLKRLLAAGIDVTK